jgi:2,3-bisphosphoglycerate-dependent phosphoglycerate mutase
MNNISKNIAFFSSSKIVLIRHGQSVWNKEKRWAGWSDVRLSEKGIEQAK